MSEELTEQWRNVELKAGYYYFKTSEGVIIGYIRNTLKHPYRGYGSTIDDAQEVLAPVPTYEEYLKLESDSLAKQEGVEIVAELENAIASQADFYQQQISVLEDRVKELKIQIGAYESCLALMPDSFEGVEK